MEVRLFGEFEALAGGVPVPVRGARQCAFALRDLHARILAQDPALDRVSGPASPGPAQPVPAGHPGDPLRPAPLLATKFYVPRSRHGLVPRPRLGERLDRGTASTLTLVSAPAGFGKTTLLAAWLTAGPAGPAGQRAAAWLSLDQSDNDPVSFWTYLIAALRTAAPAAGESALALLQAPSRPRGELTEIRADGLPVPALKARVWIAQGSLGEALGWVREQGLSVDDDLSYLREFEHITLARVLMARYADERAVHEAIRLLERLLLAADEGGRTGRVIEILVLRALAQQALGDTPAALGDLERALTLAEPEGYVRVFADAGSPMAALLKAAAKQGTARNYVRRLLAALTETEHERPGEQPLIEPLSERELDVLRLLGTELDGPAIARELMVSLNTVRTHTKHIYAKLAVTSRRSAVRRAAELGLPRARHRQP